MYIRTRVIIRGNITHSLQDVRLLSGLLFHPGILLSQSFHLLFTPSFYSSNLFFAFLFQQLHLLLYLQD